MTWSSILAARAHKSGTCPNLRKDVQQLVRPTPPSILTTPQPRWQHFSHTSAWFFCRQPFLTIPTTHLIAPATPPTATTSPPPPCMVARDWFPPRATPPSILTTPQPRWQHFSHTSALFFCRQPFLTIPTTHLIAPATPPTATTSPPPPCVEARDWFSPLATPPSILTTPQPRWQHFSHTSALFFCRQPFLTIPTTHLIAPATPPTATTSPPPPCMVARDWFPPRATPPSILTTPQPRWQHFSHTSALFFCRQPFLTIPTTHLIAPATPPTATTSPPPPPAWSYKALDGA